MSEIHAEISSPTQLRPMRRSHSAPISLQKLMDSDAPKNFTTLSRSAGRETKYASFHLLPSGFAEKQLTKPGVIRPLAVIPKVPEEREEYQPNPFRDYLEETSDAELQQLNDIVRRLSKTDATRCPGVPKMRIQDTTDGHSHGLLQITEEEEGEVNKSFTA
ncbi:muscular LMNA-interacting protein-like isoform X2 [Polyodon spathula]|uniref:muscular LMNA-interacting protein-like isoform X2 n=1 Tax=Polyodon spathula TaxID=7913 RepID=UPI001B7E38D9|nr:muscular LMNA-interacting protein-like isoform X2 [Polyodon spathula]